MGQRKKRRKIKNNPGVKPLPIPENKIGINNIPDVGLAGMLALHFKNEDNFHGITLSPRTFDLFQYALLHRTEIIKILLEGGVLMTALKINSNRIIEINRNIAEGKLKATTEVLKEAVDIQVDSHEILNRLVELRNRMEQEGVLFPIDVEGLNDGEIHVRKENEKPEANIRVGEN